MSEFTPGLKSISMDYLYIDMPINDTIYNHTGKVVLLAQGEVLTQIKFERLKKFNTENNSIRVSNATYEKLIQRHNLLNKVEEKEEEPPKKIINKFYTHTKGYVKLTSSVGEFINDVKNKEVITFEDVNTLQKNAVEKLKEIGTQDILKSVNMPRPMHEELEVHSTNVSVLNGLFARWLYLKEYQVRDLILIGLLHDIGKTKIPKEILDAPRKLTKEEFEIIKLHPVYSYDLLTKDSENFSEAVLRGVRHHHEKINGEGYPDALKGNEIDLFSKITAITDVYDALTSKRVYKDEYTPFEVCDIMLNDFSNSFDSDLAKLFIQNISASLAGSNVLMNDKSIAVIKRVLPLDIKYPIVQVGEKFVMCSSEFYPVKLLNN